MTAAAAVSDAQPDLLSRLQRICRGHQLDALHVRLADLAELVATDMLRFEAAMPPPRSAASDVELGAHRLLAHGGKHLRPICVALAARLGSGFDERVLNLALAVEMVHAATLLHDDVVDLGSERRGAPATRMVYGNAVSIFAGDWLLVEALKRVRRAGVPRTLDHLLDVIEEMILAESAQLERRHRLDTTVGQWFEVVEGKTAALFRWAMVAGARAGGLPEPTCLALQHYGTHLGIAFQSIDDVLDLAGDPAATGKSLFTDLREGKLTYPLIVAMQRESELRRLIQRVLEAETLGASTHQAIQRILLDTGALEEAKNLAQAHAERAKDALSGLAASRARNALETVADAVVHRPS